ncbi:MAG: ATP synthase F0 subunit B [bacterium]|nr:ATP synthase F0 subunit B [bacterium]
MFVLNKIYFKPVGNIIDERESKIEKENALIESMTSEIETKTQHIEKALKDAKKEASSIKEELIKKGESLREQLITDARNESKITLDAKLNELDKEIADAEQNLEQQVSVFSDKIKKIFI